MRRVSMFVYSSSFKLERVHRFERGREDRTSVDAAEARAHFLELRPGDVGTERLAERADVLPCRLRRTLRLDRLLGGLTEPLRVDELAAAFRPRRRRKDHG